MKSLLPIFLLVIAFAGCEDQVIKGENEVVRTPSICPAFPEENEPSSVNFAGISEITDTTPTSVKISWDHIEGIHSYNVIMYTQNSREIIKTVNAPKANAVIKNLTPDTEYRFLVRALDTRGFIDSNLNIVTVRTKGWPNFRNQFSVSFNGNQSVNIGPSSNYGAVKDPQRKLSVSMWIKPDLSNVTNEVRLLTFHEGANPGTALSIGLTPSQLVLSYRDKVGVLKTFEKEVSLGDNRWHHVAMTAKNSLMKLFVDGKLLITLRQGNILFGAHAAYLGSYTGIQKGYVGLMDEVSIYGSQLSRDDVLALYSSRASQDPRDIILGKELISWYQMGDDQADSFSNIEDIVGNNNGTPMNMSSTNFIQITP